MMLVTKEEFLLAAFSLRIQEVFRLHGVCPLHLHPDLLKQMWDKATVENKTIVLAKTSNSAYLKIAVI